MQRPRARVPGDEQTIYHPPGEPFESARAVLANMAMDVEHSIELFEAHGGYCDCEVMLNIGAADDDVPPVDM